MDDVIAKRIKDIEKAEKEILKNKEIISLEINKKVLKIKLKHKNIVINDELNHIQMSTKMFTAMYEGIKSFMEGE